MSAPTLWIFAPFFIAVGLYFLRRKRRIATLLGIIVAIVLAFLAWLIPIDQAINLDIWSAFPIFKITAAINLLGRRLILENTSRPTLVLLYGGVALWFIGALAARTSSLFIPLGLATATILTAALAVDPFLYAAPLIEIAVLASIPLIATPGRTFSNGVLRLLIFQTLGMLVLLFAGWMLNLAGLNPSDNALLMRATVVLGLGFFLVISAFPFSMWIPMVAEQAHPYTASFIFFTIPEVAAILGFNFLQRFSWLQTSTGSFPIIEVIGAFMLFIGGIWAAFQRDLGRIFGLAVTMEIGLILISLGQARSLISPFEGGLITFLNSSSAFKLILCQLLPRGLNLALWGLALTTIKSTTENLRYRNIQGKGRSLPIATSALAISSFSLAGFPLLAGFTSRAVLLGLVSQESKLITLISLIGFAGLFIATIRSLAVLVPDDKPWKITESRSQSILLIGGCIILFLVGLFPQWSLTGLVNLLPPLLP